MNTNYQNDPGYQYIQKMHSDLAELERLRQQHATDAMRILQLENDGREKDGEIKRLAHDLTVEHETRIAVESQWKAAIVNAAPEVVQVSDTTPYEQGYAAGERGGDDKNPYDPSGDARVGWYIGWCDAVFGKDRKVGEVPEVTP